MIVMTYFAEFLCGNKNERELLQIELEFISEGRQYENEWQ